MEFNHPKEDMEDIVIVESHDYAQVVFDDIKDCFKENQSLECHFTINSLLKADLSDWVGIYKVGFVNHKDHFCFVSINIDDVKDNKGKVFFKADDLPKDDGEFYQFVYVSQSRQIRGASIPFQFKRTHLSDYVQVEDNEAVLIQSKESAINDTIIDIKSRCAHLSHANLTYEKLILENEDLIQGLKEEVSSIKLRCFRLTMDNEKLNHALKTKAGDLKNLADTMENLSNDHSNLQSKYLDLTTENKDLMDSLQIRIDQVALLKNDLESVKMENIVSLEKQVDERVEELTKIKNDLKNNELLVSEQTITIQSILSERDNLNETIEKLTKEKSELTNTKENLSHELKMSRDKLHASEQCKEMLRDQLVTLTNELNESNNQNEKYSNQIRDYQAQEKNFELEGEEASQKINNLKSEHNSKMEETSGSNYALKLAHSHLEAKLKQMDKAKVASDKDLEAYKRLTNNLKLENEELKERINAGGKEYSKLAEKIRMLKSQNFMNNDMNVYHDLNTGDAMNIKKDFNYKNQYQNQHNTSSSASSLTQRVFMNERQHQLNFRHSTPAAVSEQDSQHDSAICRDSKTPTSSSHSARASSTDIENTLLDALLGSSFPWNDEINKSHLNKKALNLQKSLCKISGMSASSPDEDSEINTPKVHSPTSKTTTTTQPTVTKLHHENSADLLSDNQNENTSEMSTTTTITSNTQDDNVFSEITASTDNKMTCTKRSFNNSRHVESMDTKSCNICNYIFPTDSNISDFENHFASHYGPTCPICFMLFRKDYSQEVYEKHVNGHFATEN